LGLNVFIWSQILVLSLSYLGKSLHFSELLGSAKRGIIIISTFKVVVEG